MIIFKLNSTVATYEGETLSLIRISRLDMGIYVCTASNGIPPAASRRIAVNINCTYFFFSILKNFNL
jgi:hypothetical protein